MNSTIQLWIILAGGVSLLGASAGQAQDWAQWRGNGRDGKAAAFAAPKTWPKELTQKWKVDVGSGDATPALVGDKLYVFARQGEKETIQCLKTSDGKEVWHFDYDVPAINGPDASVHGGPRSSPTVADGKVVTLGVCGMLTCVDAASGKKLWQKDDFAGAWPRFHTATSPLVTDGLCVVQLGKESEGGVVAYDLTTGDQKWKWTAEGPGYASPVPMSVGGTKMVVMLTAKSIVGLGLSDGKLLWQAAFVPQGRAYNTATPIVDGQTVIYCGQGRGCRAVKIEKDGDSFTAKELWSNPEATVQFNSPVLKNGRLYGLSDHGNFFCLDASTGKTLWTDSTGGRGGFGSVVDAGSVLIALTQKSQMTVFQPSDKEYTELANMKVAEKQTYAYPVVAGNRLFVKDLDSVTLWTVD